ncbi:hypothetical protein MBUL_03193 [Methylobacterium bullatum]|uniref:Uncharacterized protein n=1 Tax=Methylobacterium bullatum TaxID=570505 RepID=A0A679J364_9HYPH|nr:hypothetical protein MBUL_03193 [Methylobacterium bullatum]
MNSATTPDPGSQPHEHRVTAYFDLREGLADTYRPTTERVRVAKDAGAKIGDIAFEGAAIGAWSNCPTSAPVGQIEGLHERRMAGSS